MDCEQIENLLSAEMDGEIGDDDARTLAAHLDDCERCRQLRASFVEQDRELREAFADRRRAADALSQRLVATFHAGVRQPKSKRLLPLVAALALGFILGWMVFAALRSPEPSTPEVAGGTSEQRPDEPPDTAPEDPPAPDFKFDVPPEPVTPARAKLAYATGVVESRETAEHPWTPLNVNSVIPAGTFVRCGADTLGELHGADGSILRLDRNSVARRLGPRRWSLEAGRVDSTVARGDGAFDILTGNTRVTALGTRFELARRNDGAQLSVFEGTTKVDTGAETRILRGGEIATIGERIRIGRLDAIGLAQASSWMHELLLLEDRDDSELERRLDGLLAGLGKTKIDLLYEKEIRSLGTHCVVPLLRYIASPASRSDIRKRQKAARIVADLATVTSVRDLVRLLPDTDGEIRGHAAAALQRLTGVDFGLPPSKWRTASWAECEPAYLRWIEWQANIGMKKKMQAPR